MKAERSRQKVLESAQKAAHTQRTEAAQARREEKRRAEKEKIMNEDDPDKQRKLEARPLFPFKLFATQFLLAITAK